MGLQWGTAVQEGTVLPPALVPQGCDEMDRAVM